MHGLQRDRQEVKTFPGLPAIDRRLFLPDEIIVSVEVPFERWPERIKETMEPGGPSPRTCPHLPQRRSRGVGTLGRFRHSDHYAGER